MRGSTEGCIDTFHKVILKPRKQQSTHERESDEEDEYDLDQPDRKKSKHEPETPSKMQRMVTRSQTSKMDITNPDQSTTGSVKSQNVKNKLVRANGLNCKLENSVKEINRHVHANGLNRNSVNESNEKLNKPVLANSFKQNL